MSAREARRRPKAVCPYCGGLVQVAKEMLLGVHEDDDRLQCAGSREPVSRRQLIRYDDAPALWRSGIGVAVGGEMARRLYPSRVRRVRARR